MRSGEGAKSRVPGFLGRLHRLSCGSSLRNKLAFFVILIILLSTFSYLAAVVRTDVRSGDGGDVPARSTTIYLYAFTAAPNRAYVGDVITFNVSAGTNIVGAPDLNITIYYDYLLANGTVNPNSPIANTSIADPVAGARYWFNTTYVYNAPGNYTYSEPYQYVVRLLITDGVSSTRDVKNYVTITENEAPYFSIGFSVKDCQAGVPYEFSVTCFDNDNDNLTLSWDFGDGSDIVENVTGPAIDGVMCNQTHAWNPDPEDTYGIGGETYLLYYLNLSLTDGRDHWTNKTAEIRLRLPYNMPPEGTITTNATTVDPSDEVWVFGRASDLEGEPMTWTFVFNDSEEDFLVQVFHTGLTEPNATVYVNTSYVFSEAGNYTVWLFLSDISDPELQNDPAYAHNTSVGCVFITVVGNRIPSVLASIRVADYYTGSQDVVVNDTSGVAIAIFTIQANDVDGDVLYATWDFGDDTEQAYNQSLGGTRVYTFNQIHEFSAGGQYNVSVVITDGREGHDVLRYKLVNVTSNNAAPEVSAFRLVLSNSSYGLPGSVATFILTLYDLEHDPLVVMWDFGDGSPLEWTNVSSFAENGTVVCTIDHVYEEVGDYHALINFTDGIVGIRGLHEESWAVFVKIALPYIPLVRIWNWWDYTSLSLVFIGAGLLVAWGVAGSMRRRRLDLMGVTLEEYKLRKQETENFEKRHKDEEGSS